jgi:hypothetical protein
VLPLMQLGVDFLLIALGYKKWFQIYISTKIATNFGERYVQFTISPFTFSWLLSFSSRLRPKFSIWCLFRTFFAVALKGHVELTNRLINCKLVLSSWHMATSLILRTVVPCCSVLAPAPPRHIPLCDLHALPQPAWKSCHVDCPVPCHVIVVNHKSRPFCDYRV